MANNPVLSKIVLPSGTTYDIKDAYARAQIEALSGYTYYLGVTTTALTDGSTTNPITINGESITASTGGICTYDNKEFIWNGSAWQEFGDMGALGDLAYSDTASGTYTPAGNVEAGAISVKTPGATATVHNPTKETVAKTVVAAAPSAIAPDNAITYYSVANETLTLYQIGYTTGDSISISDVTVKTGDAEYESANPTFTGTQATIQVTPDS